MNKIRTIKEILEIDMDLLYENSTFRTNSISESSHNKSFLVFDINSKFFNIFDQFQVSIFDDKAYHLQFQTSHYDSDHLKKLLDLIVDEYGTDENDQNSSDWNTLKHMSWWFKNKNHEPTYDDYDNTDDLYYGIMISEDSKKGIELTIIDYKNLESKFNTINWLKHRV